jgi:hypothetical protein
MSKGLRRQPGSPLRGHLLPCRFDDQSLGPDNFVVKPRCNGDVTCAPGLEARSAAPECLALARRWWIRIGRRSTGWGRSRLQGCGGHAIAGVAERDPRRDCVVVLDDVLVRSGDRRPKRAAKRLRAQSP